MMRSALLSTVLNQWAGLVGLGGISFLFIIALIGPELSPFPPDAFSTQVLLPPSLIHPLGTNGLGQDILSQAISGCRISLSIGLGVGFFATLIGFLAGTAAGYYPGWLQSLIMRIVDVFMTIPRLPLIIVLAAFLRPSLSNVALILILLSWPVTARTVRSCVLSLRELDYLKFVRFMGAGFFYVLRRHIWPEVLPILVAKFVTTAGYAIVAEAGLSFLGLGDPTKKSWGAMIRQALDYPGIFWTDAWIWWLVPPSILVSFSVLCLTLLGYALEQSMSEAKDLGL